MKKLIAISVMLALIAGAVFADTSVSGAVETRYDVAKNGGGKDEKTKTGGQALAEAYIQLSGANDEGTMGATLRIKPIEGNHDYSGWAYGGPDNNNYPNLSWSNAAGTAYTGADAKLKGGTIHKAFVWWQPIPQVQVFLGQDPDGMFGTDELVSYNFYGSATGYLSFHDWNLWRGVFPGNWDGAGLAFIVKPIDGLEIDLVVDHKAKDWKINDIAGALRLTASYDISGIGKLFLVYRGAKDLELADSWAQNWGSGWDPGYADNIDTPKTKTGGQFAASFQLTAVEGFKIQPGFSTILSPNKDVIGQRDGKDPVAPTFIGLGVWYTGEGFGAKLRGTYILNYTFSEKRTRFVVDVAPYYAISDTVTAYLYIGYDKLNIDDTNNYNDTAIFSIAPSVKASFGPGALGIGVKIQNTSAASASADPVTSWSIPLRFVFSF